MIIKQPFLDNGAWRLNRTSRKMRGIPPCCLLIEIIPWHPAFKPLRSLESETLLFSPELRQVIRLVRFNQFYWSLLPSGRACKAATASPLMSYSIASSDW